MAIGAYEAVTELSLTNPNATWQQKVMVGAGGAVIGGIGAGLSLYASSATVVSTVVRAAAPVILAGGFNTLQTGYTNLISNKPAGQNLTQSFVFGATAAKIAAPIVNRIMPTTPGRPGEKIFSSSKLNHLGRKSIELVKKNVVTEFIASNIRLAASVITTLLKPPVAVSKKL